ncbi:hypothetical protein MMC07_000629 [Pseudocyphellaria aurata]|nr:hypothetical protein [Pseudocyphellaria aurata]
MPGIFELYNTAATDHIKGWAKKPHKISRWDFECRLLRELEKASFPFEMKMAWYHTVLTSEVFDDLWLKARQKYSIPLINIARYDPDEGLCEYSVDDDSDPSINDSPCSGHEGPTSSTTLHSSPPLLSLPPPLLSLPKEYSTSATLTCDDSNSSNPEEVWWGQEGQEEKERQRAAAASRRAMREMSADGMNNDSHVAKKQFTSKPALKLKLKRKARIFKGPRKTRRNRAANAKK